MKASFLLVLSLLIGLQCLAKSNQEIKWIENFCLKQRAKINSPIQLKSAAKDQEASHAENLFLQAKQVALTSIKSWKLDSSVKSELVARVSLLEFQVLNESSPNYRRCKSLSLTKNSATDPHVNGTFLLPNMTVAVCPAFINAPEQSQVFALMHEIVHSFDPCRIRRPIYQIQNHKMVEKSLRGTLTILPSDGPNQNLLMCGYGAYNLFRMQDFEERGWNSQKVPELRESSFWLYSAFQDAAAKAKVQLSTENPLSQEESSIVLNRIHLLGARIDGHESAEEFKYWFYRKTRPAQVAWVQAHKAEVFEALVHREMSPAQKRLIDDLRSLAEEVVDVHKIQDLHCSNMKNSELFADYYAANLYSDFVSKVRPSLAKGVEEIFPFLMPNSCRSDDPNWYDPEHGTFQERFQVLLSAEPFAKLFQDVFSGRSSR